MKTKVKVKINCTEFTAKFNNHDKELHILQYTQDIYIIYENLPDKMNTNGVQECVVHCLCSGKSGPPRGKGQSRQTLAPGSQSQGGLIN